MGAKSQVAQLSPEARTGLEGYRSRDQKQAVGLTGPEGSRWPEAEQRPKRERDRERGCSHTAAAK